MKGRWAWELVEVDGASCIVTFKRSTRGEHKGKPYCEIDDVYVEPELRGKGNAKRLLNERVKRIAKENGCYQVHGHSRFSNVPAHRTYLGADFIIWGLEYRCNLGEQ